MQQRQHLDVALRELNLNVVKMGSAVQSALRTAMEALERADLATAEAVVDGDEVVNRLQREIEAQCIRLIATQQPVATDLRQIVAGLHIATDLERMGDNAVDIAKTVLRMGADIGQTWAGISHMAGRIDKMLSTALNAYVEQDQQLARELAAEDDEVDHAYRRLLEELLRSVIADPNDAPAMMSQSFIARHLERIGDHVTNIGESVIYIVSGERSDLN
ncbi:MAG: phosphate signaling complex protein PhoU [Alicyclobacillus sp.]|nr:phosphate signaling complex protein PhoU [Alicyclobacillus sp.]